MEVYILDSLYRRITLVDTYESLIWTERFSAWGDFELHLFSTLETRARFIPGVRLAIKESYRVMTVETVEDSTDIEGRQMLKVTGRSLEAILESRLAMADLTDLTTDPKWIVTGLPKAVATQLFHDICVTGIIDSGDIISGVTEGSLFSADTIDAPSDSITYSMDPQTLYSAMKTLVDAFSMGFRLVRDPITCGLYFDVYMGSDRTTSQTALAAVVFSPDLENLKDTSKMTSIATYKNVAYVVSKVGHEIVYPTDVDPTVAGFERNVLFVKADSIDDPSPTVASAQMIQLGKEELAKNRRFTALDGEVTQTSKYVYGTDYNLGDLVELRDDDGATSKMQITEQIFVSDKEGVRSYPTLTVNVFVTPGSWLALGPTIVWDDYTTEHWTEV
jgi:hypothetical protein